MAQRVGRGIDLLFHDRGTTRGWVVSSTPQPLFTSKNDPVPIVQEARWAPGPVWTGRKSRPTGIRFPDHPAHSHSLYRLSYPAYSYTQFIQETKNMTQKSNLKLFNNNCSTAKILEGKDDWMRNLKYAEGSGHGQLDGIWHLLTEWREFTKGYHLKYADSCLWIPWSHRYETGVTAANWWHMIDTQMKHMNTSQYK